MSKPSKPKPELTHETQYLLAKLDLQTERLLAIAEAIVIANANRYATDASIEARVALD